MPRDSTVNEAQAQISYKPGQSSLAADLLSMAGLQHPVAYTRVTRTPVYTFDDYGSGDAGHYAGGKILVNAAYSDNQPVGTFSNLLRHESVHALVAPEIRGLSSAAETQRYIPEARKGLAEYAPNLYPASLPKANIVNEALAYKAESRQSPAPGMSMLDSAQFVQDVASKMSPATRAAYDRLSHGQVSNPPGPPGQTTPPTMPMSPGLFNFSVGGGLKMHAGLTRQGDGSVVIFPTVNEQGLPLTYDQALAQYRSSGKHLGVFENESHAQAWATEIQNQYYRDKVQPILQKGRLK